MTNNIYEIKGIDSIIFDLDGTLWDSTEVCMRAWNEIIKEYNIDPISEKDLKSLFGMLMEDISAKLFPNLNKEQQLEVLDKCTAIEHEFIKKEGGILYDSLEDVLKELSKKYKLFIVSNCQCGYIEEFLEYYKFHNYFVDIECAGNTKETKDKNIRRVIERNNLQNPIYVGDTALDFKSATGAGIPFVLANYGFGNVEGTKYKIETVADLIEFTKRYE